VAALSQTATSIAIGDLDHDAEVRHAAGFLPDSAVASDLKADGQIYFAVAFNNVSGNGIAEVFLSHCP
jgi:uncharacterized membrane protein